MGRDFVWLCVGWDPIFEYEGKTYAEMDVEEKVGLSPFAGPS